jgi:hypothetical protein
VLKELSDIVQGNHPERAIEASHDILFLKNELIETYIALLAARVQNTAIRDGNPRPADTYISPSTKAACRDVLNASALLHHRDHVVREDLHALRFVLTTIPGNDRSGHLHEVQQDIFAEAIASTFQAFTEADLRTVQELTTIAQTFSWYAHGTPLEAQNAHRGIVRLFLALIGKSSWHEVGYETFIEALRGKEIANPRVNELREEILAEITEHMHDAR